MKFTSDNVNQVISMEIEDAYTFYITCKLENPELNKSYDKIRWGIHEEFDIHDVFEDRVIIKPKSDKVRIRGKTIPLTNYRTEIENRIALIKKAILDHITEQNTIYKPMEE